MSKFLWVLILVVVIAHAEESNSKPRNPGKLPTEPRVRPSRNMPRGISNENPDAKMKDSIPVVPDSGFTGESDTLNHEKSSRTQETGDFSNNPVATDNTSQNSEVNSHKLMETEEASTGLSNEDPKKGGEIGEQAVEVSIETKEEVNSNIPQEGNTQIEKETNSEKKQQSASSDQSNKGTTTTESDQQIVHSTENTSEEDNLRSGGIQGTPDSSGSQKPEHAETPEEIPIETSSIKSELPESPQNPIIDESSASANSAPIVVENSEIPVVEEIPSNPHATSTNSEKIDNLPPDDIDENVHAEATPNKPIDNSISSENIHIESTVNETTDIPVPEKSRDHVHIEANPNHPIGSIITGENLHIEIDTSETREDSSTKETDDSKPKEEPHQPVTEDLTGSDNGSGITSEDHEHSSKPEQKTNPINDNSSINTELLHENLPDDIYSEYSHKILTIMIEFAEYVESYAISSYRTIRSHEILRLIFVYSSILLLIYLLYPSGTKASYKISYVEESSENSLLKLIDSDYDSIISQLSQKESHKPSQESQESLQLLTILKSLNYIKNLEAEFQSQVIDSHKEIWEALEERRTPLSPPHNIRISFPLTSNEIE